MSAAAPNRSLDGRLFFDAVREAVTPAMPSSEFAAMRLAGRAHTHLGGGAERVVLAEQPIFGATIHCTLRFEGGRARSAELMAANSYLPSKEWTRKNEILRKAWHERWAEAVFGRPLVVKPMELESENPGEPPQLITPFEARPETPMHAVFPWGSVESFYDEKGGAAVLFIRWAESPARPHSGHG